MFGKLVIGGDINSDEGLYPLVNNLNICYSGSGERASWGDCGGDNKTGGPNINPAPDVHNLSFFNYHKLIN